VCHADAGTGGYDTINQSGGLSALMRVPASRQTPREVRKVLQIDKASCGGHWSEMGTILAQRT
jgi:hypothetical protein